MAQNPYFFDKIRVDLRGTGDQRKAVPISRAKYIYIYRGKKFLGKFQFKTVNQKQSIKLGLIRDAVNMLEAKQRRKVKVKAKPSVRPPTKPPAKPLAKRKVKAKFHEFEDVKPIKTAFDKLRPRSKAARTLLGIEMYEELIALAGLSELPGSIEEYDKELSSTRTFKADYYAQIYDYTLDKKIRITPQNYESLFSIAEEVILAPLLRIYKETFGLQMFILRLKLRRKVAGKFVDTGIGTFRSSPPPYGVNNAEDLIDLLWMDLVEQLKEFGPAYLLGSDNDSFDITGFTLENVVDINLSNKEISESYVRGITQVQKISAKKKSAAKKYKKRLVKING